MSRALVYGMIVGCAFALVLHYGFHVQPVLTFFISWGAGIVVLFVSNSYRAGKEYRKNKDFIQFK